MKFKVGDKVRIIDFNKVCGCTLCRKIAKKDKVYKVICDTNGYNDMIMLNELVTVATYLLVFSSGLKKIGSQLLFDFMYDE